VTDPTLGVKLAFIDPGKTTKPASYTSDEFKAWINHMHTNNPEIRILVSLGGQAFSVNWGSFDPE
jgi:hypothetical protein